MSVALVEVVRSGFRECVHRGSVVIIDPQGEPTCELGDVRSLIFPRSSSKPLQTLAMLRHGFDPADSPELAIAIASHTGESEHLALVTQLLDRGGFTPEDLLCPAALPTDERARAAILVAGTPKSRLTMNCSGKHAAMLVTCAINRWSTTDYPEPTHPLQRAIAATVAETTGDTPGDFGVDGCGAPIVPVSLLGLARAFSGLATAPGGSDQHRIAETMRAHPFLISGTGAVDLRFMRAAAGLICKLGADGVHAGALPDGSAFAYKIEDGSDRPRRALTSAILLRMGVEPTPELRALADSPVFGGKTRVGVTRTIPGVF